jgi:hypothetical protein
MPPKRNTTKTTESEITTVPQTASSSSNNVLIQQSPTSQNEDSASSFSNYVRRELMAVKYSPSDSDRIQLAQAINNLTVRGDEFMSAFKNFDKFKEHVAQLDIQIDTKKKEHKETIDNLEEEYNLRRKKLDLEYNELNRQLNGKYQDTTKKLESDNQERIKKLENDYQDKNSKLQNEFKNNQIEVKQKLSEYKIVACNEYAKENNMVLIKQEELNTIKQSETKAKHDYEALNKSFNEQCTVVRRDEATKYQEKLKNELALQELNHKAASADMRAQIEQQKREIDVLHKTIENLKHEMAEQRMLTKEVAIAAGSKPIQQNFRKE